MKNITYIFVLAFLFAIGCSKDSSNPLSSANDKGQNLPNSAVTNSTSDAIFDIPTPTITSVFNNAPLAGSGDIKICWTYATPANTYYTTDTYKPQGDKKPLRPVGFVPTTSINPTAGVTLTPALNSPYEFWGGSQKSIVSSPSYSGHYDIERSTDGGATWTEIAETRSLCYTDNNGGAHWPIGSAIQYRIDEKSNEKKSGTQANDATHHSLYSAVVCASNVSPDTYDACPVAVSGGNGTWGDNCTWTEATGTCGNASMTMNFNLTVHHNIVNNCTSVITYGPGVAYTGPVCVTATNAADGNDIETETATWDATNNNYSVTFINPQATASYALAYDISGQCDGTGIISTTSTLNTPDCPITVTGDCDQNDPTNYSNFTIVGADGNYPTSKEGNITWVDALDITVKASGQQWNTHFTVDGLNACTGTVTAVPCSANLAIYYCLTDLQGNILETGGTTCTGNHYNIDGTNQIPNPTVGTAANYLLKLSLDAACTQIIWTINYSAQN